MTQHGHHPETQAAAHRGGVGGGVVVAVVVAVYCIALGVTRFAGAFDPWRAEGDWRQWLWVGWRSHDATLFPAGGDQVLIDYLSAMHPVVYRGIFQAACTVLEPHQVGAVFSVIAWSTMLLALFWGLRRRCGAAAAAVAVFFVARDASLFAWSTGGQPRSFGPVIVVAFAMLLLNRRHRLALLLLVIAAGVYPSVVVPCGLALGVVVVMPMVVGTVERGRALVDVVLLAMGAVAIAVLGSAQNLIAAPWWGRVVKPSDGAIVEVAMSEVGRWWWWPHPPAGRAILGALSEPFRAYAHGTDVGAVTDGAVALQIFLGVVVAAAVVVIWRHEHIAGVWRRLPWPVLLLGLTSLLSYAAARQFAFDLYYPKRMVQHLLPIVSVVVVVVVVSAALDAWLGVSGVARHGGRKATLVVLLLAMPTLIFAGDGMVSQNIFRDRSALRPLMTWAETTPKAARFAGDLALCDWIPSFAKRHVYANFTLAHPARQGYFDVVSARILRVYDAIYATDAADVLAFMDDEDLDHLVIDTRAFSRLEGGFGHLFEPLRTHVDVHFFTPRRGRFALATPPAGAVVFADPQAFEDGGIVVVGRQALRASLEEAHPEAVEEKHPKDRAAIPSPGGS